MKKALLFITILGLSNSVLAKKGGSDPGKLALQNSPAGFLSESLEHSIRLLSNADQAQLEQVKDASIASITPEQSRVVLYMQDATVIEFVCNKFIDFSNSGTVTKNEALCQMQ